MTGSLEFLHGEYFPRCTKRVDKYYDQYCTLQFMVGGELELSYDDESYALSGDWVWTCEPGTHVRFHVARHARSWAHRYVAFSGPLLNYWKLNGLWFHAPQQLADATLFKNLFDELLAVIAEEKTSALAPYRHAISVNLLERIFLELAHLRQTNTVPRQTAPTWREVVLQRVESMLLNTGHEREGRSYEELAMQCGLSLSHLRAQFREEVGVPLHTYVLQRRVALARELLATSDMPLKAIAGQLGYSDTQFFTRQFRRFTGVTPLVYRRRSQ